MTVFGQDSPSEPFEDVSPEHWAYDVSHRLRDLEITDGIGNNKFGLGEPIRRGQFITFLVRLMKLEGPSSDISNFMDTSKDLYYYKPIETALTHGIIKKDSEYFRPDDYITREEMAVMIVRALGYDQLAIQLNKGPSSFQDVNESTGYIMIARDLGIIQGSGNNNFNPKGIANREHAAAMMIRMYDLLNNSIKEVHGFYAIQSNSQKELIPSLNSVSFGWSRLEYEELTDSVLLNKTKSNNNVFAEPMGAQELLEYTNDHKVSRQLMIFAENTKFSNISELGLVEYILSDKDLQNETIELIINEISNNNKYDGILIDFELMRGNHLAKLYNDFLHILKKELKVHNKHLYVAVHPIRMPGQPYYDGYDYKTIGEIADKVIIMAHDYGAKKLTEQEMLHKYTVTPLTPIDEVYYAIKAATDSDTGIEDKTKIWLQISFDSIQWKIKDNIIINSTAFRPSYDAIYNRMLQDNVILNYSNNLESPYITFLNESDETDNIIWYENTRSINAKIDLARLFGVEGISIWRLGNIPNFNEQSQLDVWQSIINNK